MTNIEDLHEIEKLAELRDKGVISDKEFLKQKKQILAGPKTKKSSGWGCWIAFGLFLFICVMVGYENNKEKSGSGQSLSTVDSQATEKVNEEVFFEGTVSRCTTEERVIFSCVLKQGKILSLCGSPVITNESGYLQYRIGFPGKESSLIYPEDRAHPADSFWGGSQAFSGGGATHIRFNIGQYSYVVFTGLGRGWKKEGVVVKRNGQQISYLSCDDNSTISDLGLIFFDQIGIPEDPVFFEIPD